MRSIALEPAINDPLLTSVPLAHKAVFYPYGFPAAIRSNSRSVIRAAEMSWGMYTKKFDHMPFEVRMLISNRACPAQAQPPISRSQGHLVSVIADAENFVCIDLNAGFGFGWATPATVENTEYFRQCLLDVVIFFLLEIHHLVIVHAACVMFQGKGILFAGDSGAGKSSLAYACARRGWTYVSDDESALLRHVPEPRVLGHPHRFRFRGSAGQLFPEFRGRKITNRLFEKPTIEIETGSLAEIDTVFESPIDFIVFLNRASYRSGPPELSALPFGEVWRRLSACVWAVQLPAIEERLTALERLASIPAYEMRYGALDPAIDLLQKLAQGVSI